MKYTIKYGQSLTDVSFTLYQDVRYVYDLVAANPVLDNIDNTTIVGLEIDYTPIVVGSFKPVVAKSPVQNISTTVHSGQTLFDLSLQLFGTSERVYDVIALLGLENIDAENFTGTKFNSIADKTMIPVFVRKNKITFNTGQSVFGGGIITPNEKEFQDGVLFEFQDGTLYNYQGA